MPSQANQALRRILRTGIQLVVGLGVVGVMQLLGSHIPAAWLPQVTAVVTLGVAAGQNFLESNGLLPIIFPNSHPPAQPVASKVEATK